MTRQLILFRSRLVDAMEGRREAGVTAVEYGIMAALIVVALLAGYAALATNVQLLFNNIAGNLHL